MDYWRKRRSAYEARRAAIIAHLKKKHGADRVNLRRVEHRLLSPGEASQSRARIDAAETYIELPETLIEEAAP